MFHITWSRRRVHITSLRDNTTLSCNNCMVSLVVWQVVISWWNKPLALYIHIINFMPKNVWSYLAVSNFIGGKNISIFKEVTVQLIFQLKTSSPNRDLWRTRSSSNSFRFWDPQIRPFCLLEKTCPIVKDDFFENPPSSCWLFKIQFANIPRLHDLVPTQPCKRVQMQMSLSKFVGRIFWKYLIVDWDDGLMWTPFSILSFTAAVTSFKQTTTPPSIPPNRTVDSNLIITRMCFTIAKVHKIFTILKVNYNNFHALFKCVPLHDVTSVLPNDSKQNLRSGVVM